MVNVGAVMMLVDMAAPINARRQRAGHDIGQVSSAGSKVLQDENAARQKVLILSDRGIGKADPVPTRFFRRSIAVDIA
jgi:hypothetical protein